MILAFSFFSRIATDSYMFLSSYFLFSNPRKPTFSFNDREDAKLILELEKTLFDSPKFNLEKFRTELHSKDMYGNDQVSKQHVMMAASNNQLQIRYC